eukprot:PhF_6_TR38760/c0_g1_i1/m.58033
MDGLNLYQQISMALVASDYATATRCIESLRTVVSKSLWSALMSFVRFEEERHKKEYIMLRTTTQLPLRLSECFQAVTQSFREFEAADSLPAEVRTLCIAHNQLLLGNVEASTASPITVTSKLLHHLAIATNHMLLMHKALQEARNALTGNSPCATWLTFTIALHTFNSEALKYIAHRASCEGKTYDMGPEPSIVQIYNTVLCMPSMDPIILLQLHNAVQYWSLAHFYFGRVLVNTQPAECVDTSLMSPLPYTPKMPPKTPTGFGRMSLPPSQPSPWYKSIFKWKSKAADHNESQHKSLRESVLQQPGSQRSIPLFESPHVRLEQSLKALTGLPREIYNPFERILSMWPSICPENHEATLCLLKESPECSTRFSVSGYQCPATSDGEGQQPSGLMKNWDVSFMWPEHAVVHQAILVALVAQTTTLKATPSHTWKCDYDTDKAYFIVNAPKINPNSFLCVVIECPNVKDAQLMSNRDHSEKIVNSLRLFNEAWEIP